MTRHFKSLRDQICRLDHKLDHENRESILARLEASRTAKVRKLQQVCNHQQAAMVPDADVSVCVCCGKTLTKQRNAMPITLADFLNLRDLNLVA